jgi:hypothetical protein
MTKPIIILLLLALASTMAASGSSTWALEEGVMKPGFNPTGYFLFAGQAPRALGEVKRIDLTTADTKQDLKGRIRWYNVPPHGALVAAGRAFKMARLTFDNLQLSFGTVTIGGTSYRFTGRFLKEGIYYDIQPEGVVLKGKLSRLRGRKIAAERDVEFVWTGGD